MFTETHRFLKTLSKKKEETESMTEALIKLRERMVRKATRYFEENGTPDISYNQFVEFINYKMGTAIQDEYLSDWYREYNEKLEYRRNHPEPQEGAAA